MGNPISTILVIEDDSNDILLIERAFRKAQLNSQLRIVTNGDEAIAYLQRQEPYTDRKTYPLPSLILLDLKLPRRSGLEVLQWLRQQPELKHLVVVVLTSSQEHPDIKKAYDLGANSYLVKPVKFDELVNLIFLLDRYWLKTCIKSDRIH